MQRKSHKGDVLLDGKSEVVIMDGIVIMNVRDEIISVWDLIINVSNSDQDHKCYDHICLKK